MVQLRASPHLRRYAEGVKIRPEKRGAKILSFPDRGTSHGREGVPNCIAQGGNSPHR